MRTRSCPIRLTIVTLAVSLPLAAQRTLRSHDGANPTGYLGFAVADVGDVDRDGVGDYAIGESNYSDPVSAGRGRVEIRSGATGNVLRSWLGPRAGSRFGWSIAGVGDIDRDGVPDLVVGAPFDDSAGFQAGSVTALSGGRGFTLWQFHGEGGDGSLRNGLPVRYGSRCGTSVVGLDDIDGDGLPDVAVGGPSTSVHSGRGSLPRVWLVDSLNGAVLAQTSGLAEFGHSLAALPDVNGDGKRDLAIGAPAANSDQLAGAGRILIASLVGVVRPTFDVLMEIQGDQVSGNLGRSLACPGDLNGDGFPELICHGGLQDEIQANAPARVEVYSLRDGSLLRDHGAYDGITRYGRALAAIGDLDGDGVSEYAVGADRAANNDGLIDVFDGATGARRQRILGQNGERLGFALAGIGDQDQDGRRELLTGAVFGSTNALHAGHARVVSFVEPATIWSFGPTCGATVGNVRLTSNGSGAVGTTFRLRSGGYILPTNGILLVGFSNSTWAGGALPFPLQVVGSPCQLLVSPDIDIALTSRRVPNQPLYETVFDLRLPTGPRVHGQELFFQFLSLERFAPAGFSTTNGVGLRIGG